MIVPKDDQVIASDCLYAFCSVVYLKSFAKLLMLESH